MKIALLLTGQLRTWKMTKYLVDNIISVEYTENDNIRTTLRATEEYDDENIDDKPVKRLLRRK